MGDTIPFINTLRERLKQPLPGEAAQLRMAFAWRAEQLRLNPNPPDNARIACVLMLLWEEQGDWHTALIQRTSNPHDRHSGQISFPGGQREENDGELYHTALREAQEEIGVAPASVTILGGLTRLYIPVSNFIVYPFVGYCPQKPQFSLQTGEVESVLTPAVRHFQQEENKAFRELRVGTGALLPDVPCYLVNDRAVWGATAMILSEFTALLDD